MVRFVVSTTAGFVSHAKTQSSQVPAPPLKFERRAPVAMLRASRLDLLLVSLLTTVVHAGPQNLNIHCRAHQPSRTNPRIIIKLT